MEWMESLFLEGCFRRLLDLAQPLQELELLIVSKAERNYHGVIGLREESTGVIHEQLTCEAEDP